MKTIVRAAFLFLAAVGLHVVSAEAAEPSEAPLILLATPQLADPVFGQTVLLTAPLREGARIGVILNRPTEHPMHTLFPDHKVLGQIKDPVYFGGPMLPEVMVVLIRSEADPGQGAIRVGKGMYLALSAPLIEKTLKESPKTARCYIGSVLWQAGELDEQIKAGAWSIVQPDSEMIFTRNPENLWESLQHKAHQLTARVELPADIAAGKPARFDVALAR